MKIRIPLFILCVVFLHFGCSPPVVKNYTIEPGVWAFDEEVHDPHYYAIYRSTQLNIYDDSTASFLIEGGRVNALELFKGTYEIRKDTLQLNASMKVGFNKDYTAITELCKEYSIVFQFLYLDQERTHGLDSLVNVDFLRTRGNFSRLHILVKTEKIPKPIDFSDFVMENDQCIVVPMPSEKSASQIKLEAEVDSLTQNRMRRLNDCLYALKEQCFSNIPFHLVIQMNVTRQGALQLHKLMDRKNVTISNEHQLCVDSFFETNSFHFGEIKIVPSNRRSLTESMNYTLVIRSKLDNR
ncbi:MAG: hypothetical protein P1U56_02980 [Saprospiraceae bacterium]|nr:hypothetical protein [Saprospiraceae bacterium]